MGLHERYYGQDANPKKEALLSEASQLMEEAAVLRAHNAFLKYYVNKNRQANEGAEK